MGNEVVLGVLGAEPNELDPEIRGRSCPCSALKRNLEIEYEHTPDAKRLLMIQQSCANEKNRKWRSADAEARVDMIDSQATNAADTLCHSGHFCSGKEV